MHKKLYLSAILLFCTLYALPQSPGGFGTNLSMWIKSDAASTLSVSGGLIDSWTYANNGARTFTASGSDRPTLTANSINFLPTATFNRAQIMEGPNTANAPIAAGDTTYCMFAVWRSTLAPNGTFPFSYQRVWSQRHLGGADDASGFALATWTDGRYGDQIEKSPYDQAMLLNYTTSKWNISHLNALGQVDNPTNDIEARDQSNPTGAAFTGTSGGTRAISDATNRLGGRDGNTDETLQGDIAEVIVYTDSITDATVRNRIFSYLALKYGINKAGDYIASDGTSVWWSATTNAGYTNAVFGIGKDNSSGLSVTQSVSVETSNGDGSGISGQGNMILFNPSSLTTDLNALVVGNDGGSLTETTANLPAIAAGSQRLGRQWKAQRTGDVGLVSLDFDFSGITTTGTVGTVGDFRLMVDPDGDGNFTNNTAGYLAPAGFTGNVAHFTNVWLPNGATFTFITKTNAALLPVTWRSFTAQAQGNDVVLNWAVDNNDQGKTYEVEHSTNGIGFTRIASVANNTQVKSYSFTHTNAGVGKHYYRIHQLDMDGKGVYSAVTDATIKGGAFAARLLSNPIHSNYAGLEINAATAAKATVELWTLSGVRISTQQQGVAAGTNTLRVPVGVLAAGNYMLKVIMNGSVKMLQLSKW